MTCRFQRSLLVVLASAAILVVTRPAHATPITPNTITFDDTAPDDTITLSWKTSVSGNFTSVGVSNAGLLTTCTGPIHTDSGSVTCPEASGGSPTPFLFFADWLGTLDTTVNNTIHVNFYESVGGALSDTLSIVIRPDTPLTDTVEAFITFESDVEGGTPLTALTGGTGITLVNVTAETDSFTIGPTTNPTTVTVNSDTDVPVPEPASLVLVGGGLAVGGIRRMRSRHRS